MRLVLNHLGSHVLQCAAESVPLLVMVGLNAPTEIADLDDVSILDEYVFRLDVSMDQALLVHVVYARADLYEEVEGGILAQVLLLPDQVEQVALACVLQGQVNGIFVFETSI